MQDDDGESAKITTGGMLILTTDLATIKQHKTLENQDDLLLKAVNKVKLILTEKQLLTGCSIENQQKIVK